MIFTWVLKYGKTILDVVIVLAVIFLIFLLNPFNIFGGGVKLEKTANLVTSIKAIGQLVTAEYYGEVIASYDETEEIIIKETYNAAMVDEIYRGLKGIINGHFHTMIIEKYSDDKIDDFKRKVRKDMGNVVSASQKEFMEHYYDDKEDNYQDTVVRLAMVHIGTVIFQDEVKPEKLKKWLRMEENGKEQLQKYVKDQVEHMVYYMYEKYVKLDEVGYNNFLSEGFPQRNEFWVFAQEYLQEMETRKQRRKELSIIARGWVKAGYDFGTITEKRFMYDKERKSLHFFGIAPKILNADINPWFIPERKVPGFDIIHASNGITFEDVQAVKRTCKEKLIAQSMKADIIRQADEYGHTALKEFFSLLVGEEIKTITFHGNPLEDFFERIQQDSIIIPQELITIDSVIADHLEQNRLEPDEQLKAKQQELLGFFISDLRTLPIRLKDGKLIPYNYFSRHIPALMNHGLVDYTQLEALKWPWYGNVVVNPDTTASPQDSLLWVVDSTGQLHMQEAVYWFEDSLEFVAVYDEVLRWLKKNSRFILDSGFVSIDTVTFASREQLILYADSLNDSLREAPVQGDILTYKTDSLKLLVYIIDTTVETTLLDSLLYNWNTDSTFIVTVTHDTTYADPLAYRLDKGLKPNAEQLELLKQYKTFLDWQYLQYKNTPWIVKQSKKVREDYLSPENMQGAGQKVSDGIKSLRNSLGI